MLLLYRWSVQNGSDVANAIDDVQGGEDTFVWTVIRSLSPFNHL